MTHLTGFNFQLTTTMIVKIIPDWLLFGLAVLTAGRVLWTTWKYSYTCTSRWERGMVGFTFLNVATFFFFIWQGWLSLGWRVAFSRYVFLSFCVVQLYVSHRQARRRIEDG